MRINFQNQALVQIINGELKLTLRQKLRFFTLALLFIFTFLSFCQYPADKFVIPAGWALAATVFLHIAEDTHVHNFRNTVLITLTPAVTLVAAILIGLACQ